MNNHLIKRFERKKVIGKGAGRLVYEWGKRYVLKVAISEYGLRSNKTEVKLYKKSSHRLKKYLARIKKYGKGYRWLLMRKYKHDFPKSNKYYRKLLNVRKKFRKKHILPYDVLSRLGKPNYQNLRLRHNRKIVVIDYGNFKKR